MPSFTDKLTVGGSDMDMYAALPEGSGPHPAVVIAFHVGGLDDFDRKMADQLADAGFVAVVPDLFHRFSKEVMDGPRLDRLGHLKDADIISDMNAAVDFLTSNSAINNDRIGVTGFCMGGMLTLLIAAQEGNRVAAAAPFYGAPLGDSAPDWSGLTAAVEGHLAENDDFFPPEAINALGAELRETGRDVVFHVYEGTGHGFANEENPLGTWNEAAAATAWARTVAFLGAHL